MTITPAAPLTAHPGYQSAGRDLHGRICRESYHAVLSGGPARSLRIGCLTRHRGEALCGAAPVDDCPPGLFPPLVTCPACLAIAEREHIQIGEHQ
jgi:hypothetical protein